MIWAEVVLDFLLPIAGILLLISLLVWASVTSRRQNRKNPSVAVIQLAQQVMFVFAFGSGVLFFVLAVRREWWALLVLIPLAWSALQVKEMKRVEIEHLVNGIR